MDVATFRVDGQPVPKARARVGVRGSFTPVRTRNAEEAVAWAFKAAAKGHVPNPAARYGIRLIAVQTDRRRRDLDNVLKLVMDGLNGVAWVDDQQVASIHARKVLSTSDPHVQVTVFVVSPITVESAT